MSAQDLLHVSRVDEFSARLALEMLHRLDAAWSAQPAGQKFALAGLITEWQSLIDPEPPRPVVDADAVPFNGCIAGAPMRHDLVSLSSVSCPVHADLRLAGLALALDLLELRARYPAEPAAWVGKLALDRRTRSVFTKPAETGKESERPCDDA